MPLEERVKSMMGSPAPANVKLAKIKDMYAKEGKEVPADIANSLGAGTGH